MADMDIGAKLFAQNVNAPSSSGGGKEDAKDIFEAGNKTADNLVALINSIKAIPMNIKNIFEVGINGIVDPTKGGIDINKPINASAANFSANGGPIYNLIKKLLNAGELFPQTAALVYNSGMDVSPAELGTFSPQTFSAADRYAGMEIG